MLSLCPFDISVGVGAFVIGLGQISSFLSIYSKVFRSTAKHPTHEVGSIRYRSLRSQQNY